MCRPEKLHSNFGVLIYQNGLPAQAVQVVSLELQPIVTRPPLSESLRGADALRGLSLPLRPGTRGLYGYSIISVAIEFLPGNNFNLLKQRILKFF